MKTNPRSKQQKDRAARMLLLRRLVVGASLVAGGMQARADGTNTVLTPGQMFEGGTNAYNNWVELSAGGLMTTGDAAQARQRYHQNTGAFGGIEDLHLQQDVAKDTTFSVDGRSIFDEHDYKLGLALKREDLGFLRFNFENFRTWYDGAGGFYPSAKTQYQLPNDALSLDRGEISFEGGLTLKDVPKVTFKYTHRYRDGDKSSTEWGKTHPDQNDVALMRGLSPSFYNIDEKADSFQLDATHHIKATDLGLGVRYETGTLNNTLNSTAWPGELFQQHTTDRQGTSYDLLSVHAFTETWLKKNLFFSTGALFANLDNTFSGSRASDDLNANPVIPLGYYDLSGSSHKQEYVVNLNLMATPFSQFSITPSLRVEKDVWDANSSGFETQNGVAAEPFKSNTDGDSLDVRERLDLKYTGFTNWVVYGGGEWTEGSGNLNENGGIGGTNAIIGVPAPIQRKTDDTRLFQKYFIGARWYPVRRVNVDAGGYYKNNKYDYDHALDSTPNNPLGGNTYPAFLVMQDFETYDGNVRLTLRPFQKVTLVSRYECQLSTIHTRPDPASSLGEVESSKMTSRIFAQNASWTPWSRLCLQGGFNYVASETKSPSSDPTYTQTLLSARNNYWTLNFNSTLVVDDKTDLNVGCFYYKSSNYDSNSNPPSDRSLPLGAAAEEVGVTAAVARRLTQNLRLNLKYAFSHYHDIASGGNNDYDAHMVYSSLQYRF